MLNPSRRVSRAGVLLCLVAASCSGGPSSATSSLPVRASVAPSSVPASRPSYPPGAGSSTRPARGSSGGVATTRPTAEPTVAPTSEATASPADTGSPEPQDTGGSAVSGDVPDNAVFLAYADAANAFSIQYVEGWQVQPQPDGVVIRDKDSSETVQVVTGQTDAAAYLTSTDLPALQALPGFKLEKQDTVAVKGHGKLLHLLYHAPAAPDPVTGKEVPSTVDRYYVPGAGKLGVVTLSTPDGVDNVDAFRTMIESFAWK